MTRKSKTQLTNELLNSAVNLICRAYANGDIPEFKYYLFVLCLQSGRIEEAIAALDSYKPSATT